MDDKTQHDSLVSRLETAINYWLANQGVYDETISLSAVSAFALAVAKVVEETHEYRRNV